MLLKSRKRLSLSKETLKSLTAEELKKAAGDAGGVYTDPCTPWCSIPSHYICCA